MKIIVCGKVGSINIVLLNLADLLNGRLKMFLILKQDSGYLSLGLWVNCALKERMRTPDLEIFYSGSSKKTTFSIIF